MIKILISGILGHMGRNVLELVNEDADTECVGGVDLTEGELCGVPYMRGSTRRKRRTR